jgi:hypothetical protein
MPSMSVSDEAFLQFMAEARKNIAEYGIHVTGVFATEDDPGPSFCYTAGLAETGMPELIIVGLSLEVSHRLINDIYSRYIKGDLPLEHGAEVTEALGGSGEFSVLLFEADKAKTADRATTSVHLLNVALAERGDVQSDEELTREPVQCLQIVYPDLAGNWPWDEAYDLDPRIQPCLLADREKWLDGEWPE